MTTSALQHAQRPAYKPSAGLRVGSLPLSSQGGRLPSLSRPSSGHGDAPTIRRIGAAAETFGQRANAGHVMRQGFRKAPRIGIVSQSVPQPDSRKIVRHRALYVSCLVLQFNGSRKPRVRPL
jgi:hypothetical protein